jgi:hypothetical protein
VPARGPESALPGVSEVSGQPGDDDAGEPGNAVVSASHGAEFAESYSARLADMFRAYRSDARGSPFLVETTCEVVLNLALYQIDQPVLQLLAVR